MFEIFKKKKTEERNGDTYSQEDLEELYVRALNYIDGKNGCPRDPKEGLRLLRLVAERGYTDAYFDIGGIYGTGWGVKRDLDEAEKWYLLAEKNGHPKSYGRIADIYLCREKPKEAVKWLKKGAERGIADAMDMLGYLYAEGDDVPYDRAEAIKWYTLAKEHGADVEEDLKKLL